MAVENFMTITYNPSEGVAARAVIAMLARLNPDAVIDDITYYTQPPAKAKD
ncbi:MAG: hypothetical protein ACFN4K_05840 [Pauljensenia sp.]